MKLGDTVAFNFIGESHEGEVVELYKCTSVDKALIKSNLDSKKYPVEVSSIEGIKVESTIIKSEITVEKPKKRVTKKSRVLALFESCKKEGLDEVTILYEEMEKANFTIKDISYFKAVLAEIKLKVIKEEKSIRIVKK